MTFLIDLSKKFGAWHSVDRESGVENDAAIDLAKPGDWVRLASLIREHSAALCRPALDAQ